MVTSLWRQALRETEYNNLCDSSERHAAAKNYLFAITPYTGHSLSARIQHMLYYSLDITMSGINSFTITLCLSHREIHCPSVAQIFAQLAQSSITLKFLQFACRFCLCGSYSSRFKLDSCHNTSNFGRFWRGTYRLRDL